MNDSLNVVFDSPTKPSQLPGCCRLLPSPAKKDRPGTPRPGTVIDDPMKKIAVNKFNRQLNSQRPLPKARPKMIPNRVPGLNQPVKSHGHPQNRIPQMKRERVDLNLHEDRTAKVRKTTETVTQQEDEFEKELQAAFCEFAAKIQNVFMKHKSPSQAYDAYRRTIVLHQKLAK